MLDRARLAEGESLLDVGCGEGSIGFGALARGAAKAIVRAVLLPATMKLLGDWNWYLPRRLEWLPRLEHANPWLLRMPDRALEARIRSARAGSSNGRAPRSFRGR